MSWQLAAFTILALALATGFAWYERGRPDARIVALVATLAAFAALGRIAFAAIPNVKPTTDIVLVSGYALGGAPGFVVGALAGLTSNFFFGQGPWTPWQMAAWGATGVLGAGLARVAGDRIGRWPLALVCGAAGFAFTAVQDAGDWITYSDHSVSQLGVYVGKGLGFDAVHAIGCVGFALAFGPALIRSVQRFARRLQVSWRPAPGAAAAIVAIVFAGAAVGATPAQAASPASYLLGAQNGDGGFGPAPGVSSSSLYTGWAALGLESEGYVPQSVSKSGHSLIGYIAGDPGSTSDIGSIERTILVLRAAGLSATSFASQNLIADLQGNIRSDGSVNDQVNLTAFAVLALRAAGMPAPSSSMGWLIQQQDSDGGFNFARGGGTSDVDDTGAALEALAAGGGAPTQMGRAVGFIRSQQDPDGGFPGQPGGGSNSQSTAWAVQGLIASGVDPNSVHRGGGPSPMQYLQSLIASDGHVRYSAQNDQTPVWVTAEAMMALAGKALPFAPPPGAAGAAGAGSGAGTQAGGAGAGASAAAAARAAAAKARHGSRATSRHRAAVTPNLYALAADVGTMTAVAMAPVARE